MDACASQNTKAPENETLGLDVEDIKFKKSNVPVGCIGPVTAFEARNLGFEVEIIASEHTTEGLISKIVKNRN